MKVIVVPPVCFSGSITTTTAAASTTTGTKSLLSSSANPYKSQKGHHNSADSDGGALAAPVTVSRTVHCYYRCKVVMSTYSASVFVSIVAANFKSRVGQGNQGTTRLESNLPLQSHEISHDLCSSHPICSGPKYLKTSTLKPEVSEVNSDTSNDPGRPI